MQVSLDMDCPVCARLLVRSFLAQMTQCEADEIRAVTHIDDHNNSVVITAPVGVFVERDAMILMAISRAMYIVWWNQDPEHE